MFNGNNRPVFRINIKFHGSPFQRALELVSLPPDDCFALATYKIHLAVRRQETEFLPYLFVIVGVPGLRGEAVGAEVPASLLFERVFAVRVRGFASNYRRAEVDMHFSISQDLTPLDEVLRLMREHGIHGLAARLERGEI